MKHHVLPWDIQSISKYIENKYLSFLASTSNNIKEILIYKKGIWKGNNYEEIKWYIHNTLSVFDQWPNNKEPWREKCYTLFLENEKNIYGDIVNNIEEYDSMLFKNKDKIADWNPKNKDDFYALIKGYNNLFDYCLFEIPIRINIWTKEEKKVSIDQYLDMKIPNILRRWQNIKDIEKDSLEEAVRNASKVQSKYYIVSKMVWIGENIDKKKERASRAKEYIRLMFEHQGHIRWEFVNDFQSLFKNKVECEQWLYQNTEIINEIIAEKKTSILSNQKKLFESVIMDVNEYIDTENTNDLLSRCEAIIDKDYYTEYKQWEKVLIYTPWL